MTKLKPLTWKQVKNLKVGDEIICLDLGDYSSGATLTVGRIYTITLVEDTYGIGTATPQFIQNSGTWHFGLNTRDSELFAKI